jgi:hypothetical protein
MKRIKTLAVIALAAVTVGGPMVAEAQAQKYVVTSIKQIAPNTLKYLLSHYTGAGALDTKIAALEAEMSKGGITMEGREGPEGAIGERGPAGPQGPQGESLEGPEGRASTVPGPQGPLGERGEPGEAGPEGAASELAGPEGKQGPQGERGPACEVSKEPACASTVPGPEGKEGKQGPKGEAGAEGKEGKEGKTGAAGPKGEAGPEGKEGKAGAAGAEGPAGPKGEKGEPGSGSLPGDYVTTGEPGFQFGSGSLWSGNWQHGATHAVLEKQIPAGQYIMLGQVTFHNESGTNEAPEPFECEVLLGGGVIDETVSVQPTIEVKGAPSDVVFEFALPELKQEETMKVSCTDVANGGAQQTYITAAGITALPVKFQ